MKEKKARKREKNNRDSAPYILGIGFMVVIVLLLFSFFYYHRLIRDAANMLGEETTIYERHYVLICDTRDSDIWEEIYSEMQINANEQNAYVELMTPDEINRYSLSDMVDICIAKKVDGIILQNTQEQGLEDRINAATEAGIPVVTLLSDAPSTGRISFVGSSPYTIADLYADEMIDYIKKNYEPHKQIRVAIILTEADIDKEQYQQFSEINTALINNLPDYDITVVAVRTNAKEDFYYEESIRDMYRGSDIPDFVVCFNSVVTDTVYKTVVDYNAAKTTTILGSYLSPMTKQGLRKNILATYMPDASQISQYSIEALTEYLEEGHNSAYYGINVSLLKEGDLQYED